MVVLCSREMIAAATPASTGDVLYATVDFGGADRAGNLIVTDAGGAIKGLFVTLPPPDIAYALAQDVNGDVHVVADEGVYVYTPAGVFLRSYGAAGPPTGIALNARHEAYVAYPNEHVVRLYGGTGELMKTFAMSLSTSTGPVEVDLARDQCTLFYSVGSASRSVYRYDVCADRDLPVFATSLPGTQTLDVRVLRDGSVLAANDEDIVRLSPAGALLETYSVPGLRGWISLAPTADELSFWATNGVERRQFSLATGAILASSRLGGNPLLVVGAYRVGQAVASVPALSPAALVALFALLAGVAWKGGRR